MPKGPQSEERFSKSIDNLAKQLDSLNRHFGRELNKEQREDISREADRMFKASRKDKEYFATAISGYFRDMFEEIEPKVAEELFEVGQKFLKDNVANQLRLNGDMQKQIMHLQMNYQKTMDSAFYDVYMKRYSKLLKDRQEALQAKIESSFILSPVANVDRLINKTVAKLGAKAFGGLAKVTKKVPGLGWLSNAFTTGKQASSLAANMMDTETELRKAKSDESDILEKKAQRLYRNMRSANAKGRFTQQFASSLGLRHSQMSMLQNLSPQELKMYSEDTKGVTAHKAELVKEGIALNEQQLAADLPSILKKAGLIKHVSEKSRTKEESEYIARTIKSISTQFQAAGIFGTGADYTAGLSVAKKKIGLGGQRGVNEIGSALKSMIEDKSLTLERPIEGVTWKDWADFVEYQKHIAENTEKTAEATEGIQQEQEQEEANSSDTKSEAEMKNKTASKKTEYAGTAAKEAAKAAKEEAESASEGGGGGGGFSILDLLGLRRGRVGKFGRWAKTAMTASRAIPGLGGLGFLSNAVGGAGLGIAGTALGAGAVGVLSYKAVKKGIDIYNTGSDIKASQMSIEQQQADLRTSQIKKKYGLDASRGSQTFAQMREEARASGKALSGSQMNAMTEDAKMKLRDITLSKLEEKYKIDKTPEYLAWREKMLDPNLTDDQFSYNIRGKIPRMAAYTAGGMVEIDNEIKDMVAKNASSIKNFKEKIGKPEVVPGETKTIKPAASGPSETQQAKAIEAASNENVAKSIMAVAEEIRENNKNQAKYQTTVQYTLPPYRPQFGFTMPLHNAMY